MCGIAGTVNGNVLPIFQSQVHRGPDSQGICNIDQVTFGHNRLSIIDLSENGSQPIRSTRYMLTYNGEIYNYRDMYPGAGNDAIALLWLIEKHGIEKTLRDINGMYAFALYDKLERKLHLVTDRMGQKPMYYYHDGNTFAFASQPASLLHLKDKWELNRNAILSYWKLGSVMGEDSIWQGIRKLTGSRHLVYDIGRNRATIDRYWSPQYQTNTAGIEELIIDSIQKVKLADVPVFIFLSGGIDSTLVASQFEGGSAIHLESNEEQYAKEAATRFDIKMRTVRSGDVDAEAIMQDYALKCGEPSMAGMIPYITSRETAKYAKCAISANGADELFFGYDRTQEQITTAQLAHLYRDFDFPHCLDLIDERFGTGRWLELQTYVQFDLNKTLDFASMAHSLEVRAPFLDHRLVEMALSIPQAKHGRKEILKNMLRKMGFGEQFITRPKIGFSLHRPPENFDELKVRAMNWCRNNNYLHVKPDINMRDIIYTEMASLGFAAWAKVWENKIQK